MKDSAFWVAKLGGPVAVKALVDALIAPPGDVNRWNAHLLEQLFLLREENAGRVPQDLRRSITEVYTSRFNSAKIKRHRDRHIVSQDISNARDLLKSGGTFNIDDTVEKAQSAVHESSAIIPNSQQAAKVTEPVLEEQTIKEAISCSLNNSTGDDVDGDVAVANESDLSTQSAKKQRDRRQNRFSAETSDVGGNDDGNDSAADLAMEENLPLPTVAFRLPLQDAEKDEAIDSLIKRAKAAFSSWGPPRRRSRQHRPSGVVRGYNPALRMTPRYADVPPRESGYQRMLQQVADLRKIMREGADDDELTSFILATGGEIPYERIGGRPADPLQVARIFAIPRKMAALSLVGDTEDLQERPMRQPSNRFLAIRFDAIWRKMAKLSLGKADVNPEVRTNQGQAVATIPSLGGVGTNTNDDLLSAAKVRVVKQAVAHHKTCERLTWSREAESEPTRLTVGTSMQGKAEGVMLCNKYMPKPVQSMIEEYACEFFKMTKFGPDEEIQMFDYARQFFEIEGLGSAKGRLTLVDYNDSIHLPIKKELVFKHARLLAPKRVREVWVDGMTEHLSLRREYYGPGNETGNFNPAPRR